MVRLLLWFLLLSPVASENNTMNTIMGKLKERVGTPITKLLADDILSIEYTVLHKKTRIETTPLEVMALEYRDVGVRYKYNITTAAKQILSIPEFNPKQKLYLLVHGYMDSPERVFYDALIEALLRQGECKVLVLYATALVRLTYFRVVNDIRFIGYKVAEVLADMVKMGVEKSAIHVIGCSLGAHTSGYIGAGFAKITGYKLGRITGVDPARLWFDRGDPDVTLDGSDAEFVDAIHTDSLMGIHHPIGQVNYYPNGGIFQPNCLDDFCSHVRAVLYFTESVRRPDAFLAIKCKDWETFKRNQCEGDISPMGIASKPGTTGRYYLRTRSSSPFGLEKEGLKWEDGGIP